MRYRLGIVRSRPLLSGWLILYRGGGGGWVRGQKKVCVPEIDLQVRAPLINFIFFPEEKFSDVGGWVGQPKSRGANLTPPPPPVSLSKGLDRAISPPLPALMFLLDPATALGSCWGPPQANVAA